MDDTTINTPLSTTITEADHTVSGGGVVNDTKEPDAPEEKGGIGNTLRDELKKAQAETKNEAKPEAVKPEEKPLKSEADPKDVKPAPVQGQPEAKASEAVVKEAPARVQDGPRDGDKHLTPPESVAPAARAKWLNVPAEIRAEVHRIDAAYRQNTEQYQEAHRFREELKDYDEMAKKAGTSVKGALDRYVDFDKRLNDANPMTRAKTVLELMVNSKVDPVAFAREILKNEQHFSQPQGRGQQATDPMVAQMAQRLEQLTQRLEQEDNAKKAEPIAKVYEEWSADKPDLRELEADIAEIIQSGIIQKRYPGLATDQLLTEAYRRAGGIYLTPNSGTHEVNTAPSPEAPALVSINPDAGKKSITGAPTNGKTPADALKAKSLREMLAEEARRKRA